LLPRHQAARYRESRSGENRWEASECEGKVNDMAKKSKKGKKGKKGKKK
jgi:hypothetical protein